MSAKPWYAWFPADYRAKTAHLSYVEDAAYRRLLDAYYERRGPLPADRRSLHRLASAQDDTERQAIDRVAGEFFENGDGLLRHLRCDEQLAKEAELRQKWVESGRKGGLSRAQASLKPASSIPDSHPHSQSSPHPQGSGRLSKDTHKGKNPAQAPFVPPEWIPQEPWRAWIEARVKARKAPTDYALRLAVRKLENLKEQGHEPAQVLMQSAFNGWADLYPQKEPR